VARCRAVLGAPLMATVSDLPASDWRVGAPMFFCGLLQLAAMTAALLHFRRFTPRGNLRPDA